MSCNCQKANDFSLLEPCLQKYATVPGSLITILQNAQEIYGYLPVDVILHISQRTGIKVTKIMGVATFYSQFRLEPVGKYLIMLCQGTACHVNGSLQIEKTINEYLGIKDGETTEDSLFTLKNVACLGCCSLSPVMMINDETYGSLTPEKAISIFKELQKGENAE